MYLGTLREKFKITFYEKFELKTRIQFFFRDLILRITEIVFVFKVSPTVYSLQSCLMRGNYDSDTQTIIFFPYLPGLKVNIEAKNNNTLVFYKLRQKS